MQKKSGLIKSMRSTKVSDWLDRLSFPLIFLIWISIIIIFGILYHSLDSPNTYLLTTADQNTRPGILNTIYFSFVTATTTGFGDIIPFGFYRFIAIIEVILGLILLAVVTSKLVSIRQHAILSELYEISFNEKVNRLRSSLLLFRQNISNLIFGVEEGTMRRTKIRDIELYADSFEETLKEIRDLVLKRGRSGYSKTIDTTNTELLLNSILQSLERFVELIKILEQNQMKWKDRSTIKTMNKCLVLTESIFKSIGNTKISENSKKDLSQRYKAVHQVVLSLCKPDN